MRDDYEEPDLGPWCEPIGDDGTDFEDDGDGECFVALSSRNATGSSRSAAVERWLRLPHHYRLREYLESMEERAAANRADTEENRRSR